MKKKKMPGMDRREFLIACKKALPAAGLLFVPLSLEELLFVLLGDHGVLSDVVECDEIIFLGRRAHIHCVDGWNHLFNVGGFGSSGSLGTGNSFRIRISSDGCDRHCSKILLELFGTINFVRRRGENLFFCLRHLI